MTPIVYDSPDYHALVRGIRLLDRAGEADRATLARLVTADWLEERNVGRWPDFIRGQCDGVAATSPSMLQLSIPDPFALHGGGRWHCDHVGNRVTLQDRDGEPVLWFRQGFADSLRCPLAWWLAHGPDLCRRHPVREVALANVRPYQGLGGRYRFHGEMRPMADFNVPDFLAAMLVDDPVRGPNFGWYDSAAEALAALNTVALRWAEAEADSL